MTPDLALGAAFTRLAQLWSMPLDSLRLDHALQALAADVRDELRPAELLRTARLLGWSEAEMLPTPDRARLPLLARAPDNSWGVLLGREPDGQWVFETGEATSVFSARSRFTMLLSAQAGVAPAADEPGSFKESVQAGLKSYRGSIAEAIASSVFINLLAAIVSFFSMQVYNKVIPSRNVETLIVFSLGVAALIGFEWVMKTARARVMESAAMGLDARLSRQIFERLLKIRLDQMPASVGSLAGQLRGYEQVRSFYTASTLFALVDLPAGMIFVVIIATVANPWVAAVPLVMALVSAAVGLLLRRRVQRLALASVRESNQKTGLLVETVEGAETIKAAQGGWQFLSKWIALTAASSLGEQQLRRTHESLTHYMAAAQQFSYAALVGLGAWFVVQGEITIGALVASSILGGRVLGAVMQLPGLMLQHAHCKAAMGSIEGLYQRHADNHGVARPLVPTRLSGDFLLQDLKFSYPDGPVAVQLSRLQIQPGERVAVLGPVGSGKSTLLKIMAGLYAPTRGRVWIDGMDVAQIAREALSRQLAYLQQDHRLFQGSLRENLLVGLTHPGDDEVHAALRLSGLHQFVAAHPRGLDLPIFEGGRGLSGGQKQLLAFTRMLLSKPRILLLDEPTAAMDEALERRCMQVLQGEALASSTLVLVTHKPALLSLVSRIVVLVAGRIVMDGPRDEVIAKLQQPQAQRKPAQTQTETEAVELFAASREAP